MTAVVGALLALAVWVELRPAAGTRARARLAGVVGSRAGTGRLGASVRQGVPTLLGRRRAPPADLGAMLTEVAARLRAGASVSQAWERSVARVAGTAGGAGRVPVDGSAGAVGLVADPDDFEGWLRRALRGADLRGQVAAAGAAYRLAARLGAPLAEVLDRCAKGVAEAGRAEAARRTALAGPAATARLLGWLPLGGLGLGWALGARPLDVVLGGGVGTAAGVAGLLLVLVGRRWTTALVRAARTEEGVWAARRPGRGAGPVSR